MNMIRPSVTACVLTLILLAGCASRPPSPAPVESRTRPSGAPAPVAAPQVRPPPAPAPVAAPASQAKSEPVRRAGVQVRPLETRPLDPVPAAKPAPERAPEPRPAPEVARTQPQGLKRPYSDAALAEMRAASGGEAAGATGSETPVITREEVRPEPRPAPVPDPKPAEPKAVEPKAAEPKPDGRAESATFAWPAKGRVLQGFAEPRNMGIAIAGTPGDPVQAAADGRVIFSGPGPRGYGNLVIIKHDADTLTVYAHNRALLVKDGAQVKRGQQIAELGESGTDRPKLHFEIRRNGKPVDPARFLPPR